MHALPVAVVLATHAGATLADAPKLSLTVELRAGPRPGQASAEGRPVEATFRQGEPILASFTITNDGPVPVPIALPDPQQPGSAPEFGLFIAGAGCFPHGTPAPLPLPGRPSPRDVVVLHPGDSRTTLVCLNRYVMPLAPGGYRLSGSYHGSRDVGLVAARALDFEISPRSDREMGAYLEQLRGDLRGESLEPRLQSIQYLGFANDGRAIPDLVDTLGDRQPRVRREAVSSLMLLGGPEAGDALRDALQDRDAEVRHRAATGISMPVRDHDRIVPRLVGLLSREWPIPQAAVLALEAIDTPEALEAIRLSLRADDERVRLFGAAALLARRDDSTHPLLADALEEADTELAHFICDALGWAITRRDVAGPAEDGGAWTTDTDAWITWLRDTWPNGKAWRQLRRGDRLPEAEAWALATSVGYRTEDAPATGGADGGGGIAEAALFLKLTTVTHVLPCEAFLDDGAQLVVARVGWLAVQGWAPWAAARLCLRAPGAFTIVDEPRDLEGRVGIHSERSAIHFVRLFTSPGTATWFGRKRWIEVVRETDVDDQYVFGERRARQLVHHLRDPTFAWRSGWCGVVTDRSWVGAGPIPPRVEATGDGFIITRLLFEEPPGLGHTYTAYQVRETVSREGRYVRAAGRPVSIGTIRLYTSREYFGP